MNHQETTTHHHEKKQPYGAKRFIQVKAIWEAIDPEKPQTKKNSQISGFLVSIEGQDTFHFTPVDDGFEVLRFSDNAHLKFTGSITSTAVDQKTGKDYQKKTLDFIKWVFANELKKETTTSMGKAFQKLAKSSNGERFFNGLKEQESKQRKSIQEERLKIDIAKKKAFLALAPAGKKHQDQKKEA